MGFLDSVANPMAGAGKGGGGIGGGDIDLGGIGDFLKKIFGSKPDVPDLKELDLTEEQLRAIQANIAAAPEAARLSNLTADQIDALIARQFPNLPGVSANIGKALDAWTSGKISPDLAAFIRKSTAADAVSGGYGAVGGGSGATGMQAAEEARNYGWVGEALVEKGINTTMQWLAASERLYSPAMNVFTGMLISPEQLYRTERGEQDLQFQHSWLKNQIAAMPDPVARGIHDMIMGLANSFLGGSYGGGFNAQESYARAGAGTRAPGVGGGSGGWGGEWNTGPYYVAPGGSTYYPDNLDFGAPEAAAGGGGGLPGGTLLGGF